MKTLHEHHLHTVLVLLLLALLMASSQFYYSRIDITSDRLYSLSSISRQISDALDEPVTIRYYVSSRLHDLSIVPQQIHDQLEEYSYHNQEKVELIMINTDNEKQRRQALDYELQPQQIEVIEDSSTRRISVFSGIVIQIGEHSRSLPLVFDPAAIEHQVTSAIHQLSSIPQPGIGILFGSDGLQLDATHRAMKEKLSQSYSLYELDRGDSVPPEISALMLFGGRDLTEQDLKPIDSFLVSGGNMLVAIDAVEIDLDTGLTPLPLEENAPVLQWLQHHGAILNTELVLDMNNNSIPVQHSEAGNTFQSWEEYPHWIQVQSANANPDHRLTERFGGLDLYWSSPIVLVPGIDRHTVTLLHSSANSWLLRDSFFTEPENALRSRRAAHDQDGRYILAGELYGVFQPFYDDYELPPVLNDGRMIVVGDADFASDLMSMTDSQYNTHFIAATADWLTDSHDLLDLRTRSHVDNRLNAVDDTRVFRRLIRRSQIINLVIVPLFVVGIGLALYIVRKTKNQSIVS